MRVIINDKRYGALKTLGERKQAFNEYVMQKKKTKAEERRLKQRKAKEEFTKMLEESKELTSSMRWSKVESMFEDDARFKAVERAEREELFRTYLVDPRKKERTRAEEEYRRNRSEYRQYLETCGFVTVDSQWRKVQDLLEDDERCSRLDKIDRLEIYQEYIRDLEKQEEEQKNKQHQALVKKAIPKRVASAYHLNLDNMKSEVNRILKSNLMHDEAARQLMHLVRGTQYSDKLLVLVLENVAKDRALDDKYHKVVIETICKQRHESSLLESLFRDIYLNIDASERKDGELMNLGFVFGHLFSVGLLPLTLFSIMRVSNMTFC